MPTGVYELERLVVRLMADTGQFTGALRGAERTMAASTRRMSYMGGMLAVALTAPLAYATKKFADFDNEMTKSVSMLGEGAKKMRASLEQTAFSISDKSITNATQLATAYGHLASAGYDASQSQKLLGVVEKFAVAGDVDMEKSTTLLSRAQFALGLSSSNATTNMEAMTRIGNVLTKANLEATGTSEDFARGIGVAGGALRLLGKDIEEGTALLAIWARQNAKGAAGGTQVDIVLRDLQKSALTNAAVWKALGMSVYDTSGKMLHTADIVAQLEAKLKGASPERSYAFLRALGFQDRSVRAIRSLLGFSSEIRRLDHEFRNVDGTMDRMAKERLGSLTNQLIQTRNQFTNLAIEVGGILAPHLLRLNSVIATTLGYWRLLNREQKTAIVSIVAIVITVPLAVYSFKLLSFVVWEVVGAFKVLLSIVPAVMRMFTIGGLVALAPFAKLVLIIVAVTAAVVGLAYVILGPAGLADAWAKAKGYMENFFYSAAGWLANFGTNIEATLEWLKVNWKNVFSDLLWIIVNFSFNMVQNTVVGISLLIAVLGRYVGEAAILMGDAIEYGLKVAEVKIREWFPRLLGSLTDWAKRAKAIIYDAFNGTDTLAVVNRDIMMAEQRAKMNAVPSTDMPKWETKTFGKEFEEEKQKIIEWFSDMARSPLEGFKSSITSAPKYEYGSEFVDKLFGKYKEPVIKAPEVEMPDLSWLDKMLSGVPGESGLGALGGMPTGTGKEKVGDTFTSDYALTRFALEGPGGLARPANNRRQEVSDKGTQEKLQQLIEISRRERPVLS